VEQRHKFTVTLEPSSFTQEKYGLYCEYQTEVHKDSNNTIRGFSRFLVDSPLWREPIPYPRVAPAHLPEQYGSYHQLYRLDGKLIAFGVLDILPNCISSVYFVYSPSWAWASLGKLSALYEVALAREIHQCGVDDMKWQYMGFYVHSCAKMRYKGEYSPSFLLDPETYSWHDFISCKTLLDQYPYTSFDHLDHFRIDPPKQHFNFYTSADEENDNRQIGSQNRFPLSFWNRVKILLGVENHEYAWISAPMHDRWDEVQEVVSCVSHGLGEELSQEIFFHV